MLGGTTLGGMSWAKAGRRKTTIGYLSWHTSLCGDDAHTMGIRILWGKCTTSAECKIYSNSRVRGNGRGKGSAEYQKEFCFIKVFSQNVGLGK